MMTNQMEELDWFRKHKQKFMDFYGFDDFKIVEFKDGDWGFEFHRPGDVSSYRTTCLRRLEMMIDFPKDIPHRKDPCPCGSGKKFKNCCSRRIESNE